MFFCGLIFLVIGTLIREIGADITFGALKWVVEIFFPWVNKPCQKICLYYDVAFKDETQIPLDGVFTGGKYYYDISRKKNSPRATTVSLHSFKGYCRDEEREND